MGVNVNVFMDILCDSLLYIQHIKLYVVRWECTKAHRFRNGSKEIMIYY